MRSFFFLLALFASIAFGEFQVGSIYASSTCGGSPIAIVATPTSGCTAVPCTSSTASGQGYSLTCQSTVPSAPSNTISIAVYTTTGCTGNPESFIAVVAGKCSSIPAASISYELSCSGGKLTYKTYTAADCQGTPTTETFQGHGGCTSNGGVSVSIGGCSGSSSSSCFHEDTVITYNDKQLTLPALQAGVMPECVVPHVVSADGVVLRTSCSVPALRLTFDHLVYSARGLLAASELRVGDSLFADVNDQAACNVTSINVEADQRYFGLNCEESVVLANGIKTSVFGAYHTVPSVWMKLVSKVAGVQRASAWGDRIAAFLYNWSVI